MREGQNYCKVQSIFVNEHDIVAKKHPETVARRYIADALERNE
jgi:hypothetical protein